jgi:tetratricopeptide (TPR) repeat protein
MKHLILCILFCLSFNSFSQTAELYKSKAKQFFETGKYKEAISNLNLALKINPKDFKAIKNRAMCYEKLENYDLAVKDYLELLKYDKSGETYGAVAYEYMLLNKDKEAREYLTQAISLEPKVVNYRYNLGLTYQSEKEYEEAINIYNEALKISPNHIRIKVSKSRCLVFLKQFEKARAVVDSFFLEKNFDADMLLIRGDINKHFGKIEDALNDYSRALAILPDDIELLNRSANCLADLKYFDEEVAIRKRTVDLLYKYQEKNDYKALSLAMLGIAQDGALLYEDALESFNESIKLDATEASIYFYRCIVKAKLKDNEGACQDIKKAKELNPDESDGYDQYFEDDAQFTDFVNYCNPNP